MLNYGLEKAQLKGHAVELERHHWYTIIFLWVVHSRSESLTEHPSFTVLSEDKDQQVSASL